MSANFEAPEPMNNRGMLLLCGSAALSPSTETCHHAGIDANHSHYGSDSNSPAKAQ
jgi:hypothetical protein